MDIQNAPQEPHRVEELWFQDGNIVLQAGFAQYKVYRGILAGQSAVFSDMLSFPQPLQPGDMLDGCPLVHLQDAEAEVTLFLRALFEPFYFRAFPAKTELQVVISCARLSHKYNVPLLRRLSLGHLASMLHTRLGEWDSCNDTGHDSKEPIIFTGPGHNVTATSWDWSNDSSCLIALIPLAREIEAPWLLPSLFYRTAALFENLGMSVFNGTTFHGVSVRLDSRDQENVLFGASAQQKAMWDVFRCLNAFTTQIVCPKPESTCALGIMRTASLESVKNHLRCYARDPLMIFPVAGPPDSTLWDLLADEDVCDSCVTYIQNQLQVTRRKLWDCLPGLYGLPPWHELEALKHTAIEDDLHIWTSCR